jgi:hypothetical protein
MRKLRELNHYRDSAWQQRIGMAGHYTGDKGGCFVIASETRAGCELGVIAGVGAGWDHVSVSTTIGEIPTWTEMEQIKRLFFKDHETAMQLHVPPSDHINHHPATLHLWRPMFKTIPRPPGWMVGPKN